VVFVPSEDNRAAIYMKNTMEFWFENHLSKFMEDVSEPLWGLSTLCAIGRMLEIPCDTPIWVHKRSYMGHLYDVTHMTYRQCTISTPL
jgi:hypothetical protein